MARLQKDGTFLDSKNVPYVSDRVRVAARPFLPTGPDSKLDAAGVVRFVSETDDDPDTRMAVLGVLRTHAANGAEVALSGMALLISVLGVAFSLLRSDQWDGWLVLISTAEAAVIVVFVVRVLRLAAAAHVRKMTALAWLGAYEDALKEVPRRRPRRRR